MPSGFNLPGPGPLLLQRLEPLAPSFDYPDSAEVYVNIQVITTAAGIAIDKSTIGSMRDEVSRSTYTLTTTQSVAVGGFISLGFVCLDQPTSITSVTDNGPGLTWTVDKHGAADGFRMAIIQAQAPAGMAAGTVISVNLSTSGVLGVMGACSFTGVKSSSPVDGTPLGPVTGSGSAWSTGNYAVQAGSVIVALCENSVNGNANTPISPALEIFEQVGSGGDYGIAMEYRIESNAGSVPVAGSWAVTAIWGNIAVAYLAGAVPVDIAQWV